MMIWYGITSVLLGLILFFPTRKVISSIAINRLQRKENREATAEEVEKIRKSATVYAAFVAFTFAFLYNKFVMFKYFGRF
jgi:hypothetical protein